VHGSLWHVAVDTPGCRYLRYLVFKQEGSEANLACTDLCKKRALVLQESVVFLEGVVVKERPRHRCGDPTTVWRLARVLHPAALPVYPQDRFGVLVF
jgi:hypothetical protein